MVLASLLDIHTFIVITAILSTLWALAWDHSDGVNILTKLGWILVAIWSWLIVADRIYGSNYVLSIATLYTILALYWSRRGVFNFIVKMSWGLIAIFGWFCFFA